MRPPYGRIGGKASKAQVLDGLENLLMRAVVSQANFWEDLSRCSFVSEPMNHDDDI